MTPEVAIKTIESIKFVCRTLFPPKEQEALSQGIEALKWYKGAKEDGCIRSDYFLPGETQE